MNWIHQAIKQPSLGHKKVAQDRQNLLTKPPGSLGDLESIVVRLATLQQRNTPSIERAFITIFAADHGIAEEGVSAFPQTVTQAMVANYVNGGAAINVLAKQQQAQLTIINVGIKNGSTNLTGVSHQVVGDGTANFLRQAAMTPPQLEQALNVGKQAIDSIASQQADVFIGGEMGIANTTSASALACALLKQPVAQLVGAGTGLNQQGIDKKQRVIEQALTLHQEHLTDTLSILQHLGGFEIAALVGAYIRCGQLGIPIIVDGFITTVAALMATNIQPRLNDWLFYGHQSEEAGHQHVLAALKAKPILKLNMRLGEASGAALALSILKNACALHNHMSTFEDAGVPT